MLDHVMATIEAQDPRVVEMFLNVGCMFGHIDLLQELFKAKPDVAQSVSRCAFALNDAVRHGRVEVVHFLLERVIEDTKMIGVFHQNATDGLTVLGAAIMTGRPKMLKILLSAYPGDINKAVGNSPPPIKLAAQGQHYECCKVLQESGRLDPLCNPVFEALTVLSSVLLADYRGFRHLMVGESIGKACVMKVLGHMVGGKPKHLGRRESENFVKIVRFLVGKWE